MFWHRLSDNLLNELSARQARGDVRILEADLGQHGELDSIAMWFLYCLALSSKPACGP
jgi:hypothetical protein